MALAEERPSGAEEKPPAGALTTYPPAQATQEEVLEDAALFERTLKVVCTDPWIPGYSTSLHVSTLSRPSHF
jgi:hypothetical protein